VLNGNFLGNTSRERINILKSSLDNLPSNKPRLAYGLGTPEDILLGVFEGIDLFDTHYAVKMTDAGHAFIFLLDVKNDLDSSKQQQQQTINLWDTNFRDDIQPILIGCQCHSCQNHTRAYIHHLLNAHEMLATVLLMSHNLFHYTKFFKNIRESISQDTFFLKAEQFFRVYGDEHKQEKEMKNLTII